MKVVIVKRLEKIVVLLIQNSKLQFLQASGPGNILGNIYLARVQKNLPGLQAAFVEIEKGHACFLQKSEIENLKENDMVPIQIIAEAGRNKPPAATLELVLNGKYCILTYKRAGLVFSGKLSAPERKRLKEALQDQKEIYSTYHMIIRTNAAALEDLTPLREEMQNMAEEMTLLLQNAAHRTCYSLLRKETEGYVKAVRSVREEDYEEIVTDLPEVYETLKSSYPEKVRFYQDAMLPLSKLYSVETHIQNGLARKVWLNSGGFVLIEPTETLCVIDVNTGKKDSKKMSSFLPVNKEAAAEIARQLRIRNLSGIILVDFINMESEEEEQELFMTMRDLVRRDSTRTTVIDITPLGLMEITRKKAGKTIYETLG